MNGDIEKNMTSYKQKDTQDRLLEITGQTSDIDEALDQWVNERQTMSELFDENQAYEILNRRLIMALTLAEKAIQQTEADAQMLLKENTRHTIYKFREQVRQLQSTLEHSKELKEIANERKAQAHANT